MIDRAEPVETTMRTFTPVLVRPRVKHEQPAPGRLVLRDNPAAVEERCPVSGARFTPPVGLWAFLDGDLSKPVAPGVVAKCRVFGEWYALTYGAQSRHRGLRAVVVWPEDEEEPEATVENCGRRFHGPRGAETKILFEEVLALTVADFFALGEAARLRRLIDAAPAIRRRLALEVNADTKPRARAEAVDSDEAEGDAEAEG